MSQVQCRHLLIKHTQSRNPISRRTNQTITMSKAEAMKELQQWESKLQGAGEQAFAKAAMERSDCGSCRDGGNLGMFSRGMMQKPFEDASFALNVGQMSGIVDSDSGLHLILRTQ
jgi:NIMA-interacting peptidyl-prolyl cis-trans isomerase 1